MLINLTPHTVTVGSVVIKPTEPAARVSSTTTVVGVIAFDDFEIEIIETHYGQVENLPEPNGKDSFIVSRMVKDRVPERNDVLVPGELVRDEEGRIVGCKNLSL